MHCSELPPQALEYCLQPYGLTVEWLSADAPIPGSYWGEPEAGLIGATLWVRPDTPVHSALHEACHFVCMDDARRAALHTDAGGTVLEECAVCYLQIVFADGLPTVGRDRLMAAMDAWGYSFRLGSTARWFADDAADARAWLHEHHLLNAADQPTLADGTPHPLWQDRPEGA